MPTRKSAKKSRTSSRHTRKVSVASAAASQEISYDTKTIITLLLLLFFYPLGLIFMWVWMKWPTWVRAVVTIPFILSLLFAFSIAMLIGRAVKENFTQRQWQIQYQQQLQAIPTPSVTPGSTTFQ